jgi:hypothetical protein
LSETKSGPGSGLIAGSLPLNPGYFGHPNRLDWTRRLDPIARSAHESWAPHGIREGDHAGMVIL